MKKLICMLLSCALLFCVVACGTAADKTEFEVGIIIEKDVYEIGEYIEYKTYLKRLGGVVFIYTGNSMDYSCIFYKKGDEIPPFVSTMMITTKMMPVHYYKESEKRVSTEDFEPGEYVIAVRAMLDGLGDLYSEKTITIV